MNRLGLPISVDAIEKNLNDIAGVRVICSFVDDIYKLADMLAVQDDVYVVRTKDYIKNPKESGYRSLHMIVEVPIFLSNEKRYMRVEVQLRTIAMDFWASLEHKLRYKKDIPAETADAIARQLQDCAEVVARTDKQMYDIRKQIEASGIKAGVMENSIKNGAAARKTVCGSARMRLFKSAYSNAENSISCTRRISWSPESPSKT